MPALGLHGSTTSGLKATGSALPGPGPEELTAVLGYLKPADVETIERAYEVARAAHSGQYRQSGEPYITHPLAVAKILAEWHLDALDVGGLEVAQRPGELLGAGAGQCAARGL